MTSPLVKAAQAAMGAAASLGATQNATLRRTTTTYTPATGSTSTETTDYAWPVMVEDYADRLVDGTLILASDRRALGAAGDLTVSPDPETDTLIVASTTYQIVRVKRDPVGAMWELQVRR